MRKKIEPLLCELHAHTRWSDGALALPELVDLYGQSGFDVLAVTDHVVRRDDPWLPHDGPGCSVQGANHGEYLAEIAAQADRARRDYGLLLLPGLELTYNDSDPAVAAHAVAVGCRTFVGVDEGLEVALGGTREAGAALIAAHPYSQEEGGHSPARATTRFSRDWRELRQHVDRWELFNRYELFGWVRGVWPSRCRQRRLSPTRAPARLEDASPLRQERGGRRRVPPLDAARVPHADRRRAPAAGGLIGRDTRAR